VEDDVEVVGEDPIALRAALYRPRPDTVLPLQPALDFVEDRRRLPGVPPRAEDEEVGVGADGPQVEDDDVLRQLSLGEAGDEASLFERGQSEMVLSSLLGDILASVSGVQPASFDLARHSGRHEAVDRLAAGQPLA
jgi:hypothetical protein